MRKLYIILLFLIFTIAGFSQTTLEMTVLDKETQEPLIAATVMIGTKGFSTDLEGKIVTKFEANVYKLVVSYVGYENFEQEIALKAGTNVLVIELESLTFQEVVLVADIAMDRKVPVSFSNITTKQLTEELASQDLPMILNATPGVYATQSGGGDGDARINIRGFDQRNIAVMVDGVPVNDMETGWVYWSNWFGLDLVTQTMQVQRGLGASKLALPSVGGTINIVTKGINSKRSLGFQQEYGNDNYLRSTLGFTSGKLKNGWGISLASSYKQGNGWVKGTYTDGYFYYFRVDKEISNHLFTLSGYGAPQNHGQRPFTEAIAIYSHDFATSLGISQSTIEDIQSQNLLTDQGLKFNSHIGILKEEEVNTRQNFYHKPQFNLRHSWKVNQRLHLSNLVYLSIGRGGGVAPMSSMPRREEDGLINLDSVYNTNIRVSFFNPDQRSTNVLRASMNDHMWYGILSTAQFNINSSLTLSGGVDLRSYEGDHYRTVYDLLGGSYFRSVGNSRIDETTTKLEEGGKLLYDNTGFINWAGVFGLLEYSNTKWSAFLNLSAARVGYSLEDYMKPMIVHLADTSFYVSYKLPVTHNGQTYTVESPEAQNQRIDWVYKPSFTVKSGASYIIDDHNNLFVNIGYLSRPTRYTNVIRDNRNNSLPLTLFQDTKNEIITAYELGYKYGSRLFSVNFNGYWTSWLNKPLDSTPTVLSDPTDPESERLPVNINGVAALHRGVELDFIYKPMKQFDIQGLISLGDWIWNSTATVDLPGSNESYEFDARGVHVGNSAQTQLGFMVRYEPIERLFFKVRATYFGKNYADFNPETLKGETAGRESWKMPNYTLTNFHAGYSLKVDKTNIRFGLNVLNAFNTVYLSDARNNDTFNAPFYDDFDAKSASIFFGLGRRWNVSMEINL
jgi:iron complex outermembrane recepter protein